MLTRKDLKKRLETGHLLSGSWLSLPIVPIVFHLVCATRPAANECADLLSRSSTCFWLLSINPRLNSWGRVTSTQGESTDCCPSTTACVTACKSPSSLLVCDMGTTVPPLPPSQGHCDESWDMDVKVLCREGAWPHSKRESFDRISHLKNIMKQQHLIWIFRHSTLRKLDFLFTVNGAKEVIKPKPTYSGNAKKKKYIYIYLKPFPYLKNL